MSCLKNEHVVGRKDYRCSLCDDTIPKGERHRVYVGKDDGDLHTHRYHTECDKVTEIQGWDEMDWEGFCDVVEFRKCRDELRQEGKLP